ncbi:cytochrome b [Pseudoxanthomonas beigongshangi]
MKVESAGRYPLALRLLHWLLALLLLAQVMLGFAAERWTSRAISDALFPLHFKLGVLILCLMIPRLGLRLRLPVPDDDGDAPRWHRRIRSCVHALIYLLVLALPISGHVIWVWMGADRTLLGGLQMPAFFVPPDGDETGRAIAWYVHVYGAWTLSALVGLHVAAVVFRQWRRKDGFIVRRMGFGGICLQTKQRDHGLIDSRDL